MNKSILGLIVVLIIVLVGRFSLSPTITTRNSTAELMLIYSNVTEAVLVRCRVDLTPTGPVIRNTSSTYVKATEYWGFWNNGTCVLITVPYMGLEPNNGTYKVKIFNDIFGYRYGSLDTFKGHVTWQDLVYYDSPEGDMSRVPNLSSYNQTITSKVLSELYK